MVIKRNNLYLTIQRHWNGRKVDKTHEWQYYWGNAEKFTQADAEWYLSALAGTAPNSVKLILSDITAGCIPINGATITEF